MMEKSKFEKLLDKLIMWTNNRDSLSVFLGEGVYVRKTPEEIGNAFKVISDRMKNEQI